MQNIGLDSIYNYPSCIEYRT